MKAGVEVFVDSVYVCTSGYELLENLFEATHAGQQKRSLLLSVDAVDYRLMVEEQAHQLAIPVESRKMQRSIPVLVPGVDIGLVTNQLDAAISIVRLAHLDDFDVLR